MGLRTFVKNKKRDLAIWYAVKWYKDGLKGKKGSQMKSVLSSVDGYKSAIIALVLLAEAAARQFGFEAGPVFGMIHALFAGFGWNVQEGKDLLGADPAFIMVAVAAVGSVAHRIYKRFTKRTDAKVEQAILTAAVESPRIDTESVVDAIDKAKK
jgi:hypothetical protein